MPEASDMRSQLPKLEGTYAGSGLDPATARDLVALALQPGWSAHWAEKALTWLDEGVSSAGLLPRITEISHDQSYPQRVRHHAWRYAKHDNP